MSDIKLKGYKIVNNVIEEEQVDELLHKIKDVDLVPYYHLNLEKKWSDDNIVIHQPYQFKTIKEVLIDSKDRAASFRYKMWTENYSDIGLFKQFLPEVFKLIGETFPMYEMDESKSTFNVQVYTPFDEIPKHIDGQVENRFGAVIVPITNKPKFALGGDLVMYEKDDDSPNVIESKIGDVILIDFEENDIFHEVTNVKNWVRGSIIGFLFKK